MSDTVYWGVKLNPESVAKLLTHFLPIHSNVFAEHMTMAFRPNEEVDKQLQKMAGDDVTLMVTGQASDEYGQAVTVAGVPRFDPGQAHITISCAHGVGPVYSNTLLSKGQEPVASPITLSGKIGRVDTKRRWHFRELDSTDTGQEPNK